jgi:4-hydroxyphenylpyruvate dioxygenase
MGQPHGHRRLRVHRIRRARPAGHGRAVRAHGLQTIARTATRTCCCTARASINFIINAEPDSFAQRFARLHGPSVCAIAFRVQDAKAAYERAISPGRLGLRRHRPARAS